MRGKLAFYSILGVFLLLGLGLAYLLFYKSPSETLAHGESKVRNSASWRPGLRLSESMSNPTSTENSGRLGEGKLAIQDETGPQLKSSAEVINQIMVLGKLFEEGRDQDFLNHLEELIAKHPNQPEYAALKADYYYGAGDWAQAEEAIKRLIELSPNSILARTSLGEVQAFQGRFDDAIKSLDEGIRMNRNNAEAMYTRLAVYDMKAATSEDESVRRELSERGRKEAIQFASEHKNSVEAQIVGAEAAYSLGDLSTHEQMSRLAYSLDPENPGANRAMGDMLVQKGDFDGAMRYYTEAYDRETSPEMRRHLLEKRYDVAVSLKNETMAANLRRQLEYE